MSDLKPHYHHKKLNFSLLIIFLAALAAWFYLVVPQPLFDTPYATILETSDAKLLGARIASDGQWRFPAPDSIPDKFEKCLLLFEDRHFYRHPGNKSGKYGQGIGAEYQRAEDCKRRKHPHYAGSPNGKTGEGQKPAQQACRNDLGAKHRAQIQQKGNPDAYMLPKRLSGEMWSALRLLHGAIINGHPICCRGPNRQHLPYFPMPHR
jgi:hypothetical protein